MPSLWLALGILASLPVGAEPGRPRVVEFHGACDASGAVVRGGGLVVVGDDEDNVLRLYDANRGGAPLASWELSAALELERGKRRYPETDLEAATGLGDLGLWLTSHGLDSKARRQGARFLLFATRTRADGQIVVEGRPYRTLLDDLLAAPALARFGLAEAAARPPKAPGGLNLEGMTAALDGRTVLVGLRSPVPPGGALVIPIENVPALVRGERARLGAPVQLDLGGRGIRSLSSWRGRYVIVAGATGEGDPSRLFTWSGAPHDGPVADPVDLAGLNPEAFATFENRDEILLLSDDGTRPIDGVPCKKLKDPARKRFRGAWVRLSGAP
ncbi:DUF3616 domain-containing protein [Anaeromyxobacter sp. Fw109-5]|uniref:DUF3616 domain-containing protein n=1 Tax=Anaeromyxobacter sp. (strain Fw109-5) TaxID=404589 RepID=UPI0000ED89C9|nr:DUF3616 domain-containing protein [Anaeromyxobacter sp. Fw109-5]ABS27533.1 conserved hypothetical protein [Anaeromyxobacter sp. Fw109-5]